MKLSLKNALLATTVFAAPSLVSQASLLQSWEFNDTEGTLLSATANSVTGGSSWNEDLGGTETTGGGLLSIRRPGGSQISSWAASGIDEPGQYSLILDVAGWQFVDTANENLRFGFTTGENTFITAQMEIFRTDEDVVSVRGRAFGDGTNTPTVSPFTASQDTPVRFILDIDTQANSYSLGYRIDGGSLISVGSASIDPDRSPAFLRLSPLNDFASEGEFFDIDQISLIPEPSTYAAIFGVFVGALAMWRRSRRNAA